MKRLIDVVLRVHRLAGQFFHSLVIQSFQGLRLETEAI